MTIVIFQSPDYLHPLGLSTLGEFLLALLLVLVLAWRMASYARRPTFSPSAEHGENLHVQDEDNGGEDLPGSEASVHSPEPVD